MMNQKTQIIDLYLACFISTRLREKGVSNCLPEVKPQPNQDPNRERNFYLFEFDIPSDELAELKREFQSGFMGEFMRVHREIKQEMKLQSATHQYAKDQL